jgi:hypothetical protein
MNKIDKRRHYILVLDTETANTLINPNGSMDMSSVLVYDCGWQVIDTHGTVYEQASYINSDIFYKERELMLSAYYAKKIPMYEQQIKEGRRTVANTYQIRKAMCDTIAKWGIKEVAAHNARFDYNALNIIQRYTTKSKYRYWFPYGIEIWDTMKMAKSVILQMPTYRKFCEANGFMTKTGKLSCTAENLYRFIIKDPTFVEAHTGLEDVEIESQILAYCYRQHKKMSKKLFEKVLTND